MDITEYMEKEGLRIKFITADLLVEFDKLKLGQENIDSILNGGFRIHILNEIVGCSGTGKTQICLLLSLMVQLPKHLGGFNKVAAYICTEDIFPIKRLYELNNWFQQKYQINNFLDNIFISHVGDYKMLGETLSKQLPSLARAKNIGLIVIDSIGGVFRSENIDVSYENRSKHFMKIALWLRHLSTKLNCVVICTNQVTDNIKLGTTEPCLGLSWSNLVNTRFEISRRNQSTRREFEVLFSPDLPNSKCEFYISREGIV